MCCARCAQRAVALAFRVADLQCRVGCFIGEVVVPKLVGDNSVDDKVVMSSEPAKHAFLMTR